MWYTSNPNNGCVGGTPLSSISNQSIPRTQLSILGIINLRRSSLIAMTAVDKQLLMSIALIHPLNMIMNKCVHLMGWTQNGSAAH